jgi:hypothetical protein
MQWTRSQGLHNGRFLWITDAGRAAMAFQTEPAAQPAEPWPQPDSTS